MKAMILAAGRGKRMRPLTDTTPKPLLEVHAKPLIAFHLEALARAGFSEIVINISWLGEQIRERLGDGVDYGVSIEYSEESEALETAGGIVQVLDRLGRQFVIVNADVYTDYDFAHLQRSDSAAHLVLVANPDHHAEGDFALHDGIVSRQGELRFTYAGSACLNSEFFAGLEPGRRALGPLLFEAAQSNRVTAELFAGEWHDIGTPERLQALNDT